MYVIMQAQSAVSLAEHRDVSPLCVSMSSLLFTLASDACASDSDSDNDSLGIDDPDLDLLDIPPPMTNEAWSVDEMECGAE